MAVFDQEVGAVRIIFLCLLWFIVSSTNNVVGKTLLTEFPYPLTVTMVQLLSITVYSGPVLGWMRVRKKTDSISYSYYKRIILPLAFGKFLASVYSHVSIWKVPVSYAHTVKATMPLFTVILTRVLFGERQTTKVYISLVPIILGVAIATITELSFDIAGLGAALISTCSSSLQNIFSKKVLTDTGIHQLRLLHLLGKLALFMFLPVWVFFDGYALFFDESLLERRDPFLTLTFLTLDGILSWLQNLIAFTILNYISPLTYAVASATKRIAIITVSLFLLGNPVTLPNVAGMLLAVTGVLLYNKTKYEAQMLRRKSAIIPLSNGRLMGAYTPNAKMNGYIPKENGYTGNVLTQYPIHPAYGFDHKRLSNIGPYPRLNNPNMILENGFLPKNDHVIDLSVESQSYSEKT